MACSAASTWAWLSARLSASRARVSAGISGFGLDGQGQQQGGDQ
ncbi:hypothetical protein V2J61_11970 [Pseudomonas aeruginosa]|nr:hypothetical protein [Pseudomonas aeruginosa]MEE4320489.1 hypothetical protein [Pseudomonas aeruginosa]